MGTAKQKPPFKVEALPPPRKASTAIRPCPQASSKQFSDEDFEEF
ncbi:MAG: hypothetical protein WCL50_07880 [Spirochaetota bacterium]